MSANLIQELLQNHRVIVCCGSGGVGKTTVSATLAITAAKQGKRVIVITIDPAKRLATSLGLKSLSSDATDITNLISESPISGSLHAVMPDSEKTFEAFIKMISSGREHIAEKILKTSIYKIFAQEFSGTNEYLAMERLFELYKSQKYDLVILDTPPSANTMTFLQAPSKLSQFFDDRIIKWFIEPGSKILATGLKIALSALERITGKGFISELLEFTAGLFELRSSFSENLNQVLKLLHQKDVQFIMVTSPERLSKKDTTEFVEYLASNSYPFWGFIVNRTLFSKLGIDPEKFFENHTSIISKLEALKQELPETLSDKSKMILEENFKSLIPRIEYEKQAYDFLSKMKSTRSVFIPDLNTDVHSIESLIQLSDNFKKW